MHARLENVPEMMRIRRQTVEHPICTIISWMGATHFLTRTLERVDTEMSLHVLACNIKRVIKLLGTSGLIDAIKAYTLYLLCILKTDFKKTIGNRRFNPSSAAFA